MAPRVIYRMLAFIVPAFPLRLRHAFWRYLASKSPWSIESAALRIPGGLYMKKGRNLPFVEGQALRYIGARTSLPIPVVVDDYTYDGEAWLVTSRLPGDNLVDYYIEITPEVEQKLSDQLARIMAPLRAIQAPTSAVCGFGQGPIFCERLAFGAPPLGPFESIETFHRFLLERAGGLDIPEDVDAQHVHETIERVHSRSYRICITHNDLGPHNILVDEEWNITGIIDWETCAWMPEYWEVTKGTFLPQFRKGRWARIMNSAFPAFAEEYEAERYIIAYRCCYT